MRLVGSLQTSSMGSYDLAVKDSSSKAFSDKIVGQPRRGIQTHPDGTTSPSVVALYGSLVIDWMVFVIWLTLCLILVQIPYSVDISYGLNMVLIQIIK